MKCLLRVECIGDDAYEAMKHVASWEAMAGVRSTPPKKGYWVAEIIGRDYISKFRRQFLQYKKDFSQANSVGSRGVCAEYALESGGIYEVSAPISWSRVDRYYCTVSGGEIVRLDEDVVLGIMDERMRREREEWRVKCQSTENGGGHSAE